MPIPSNIQDIFETVFTLTNSGRADWKPGVTQDMFFLHLDDFSIQLWKTQPPPGIIRVANGRWPISFAVLDSRGAKLESFTVEPSDGDWERLSMLVEKARKTVTNVDDKLLKVKQQLTAKLGT